MFVMSEATYTVRQLAEIISGSPDEKVIEKAVRQIRYWTTENIIKPIGKKHSGSGVHRLYTENEMYKAALVLEMVRHGISATKIMHLEELLESFGEDEIEAINDGSQKRAAYFIYAQAYSEEEDYFCSINYNNPLFMFEKEGMEMGLNGSGKSTISYENYTTCIVINISRLFKRLKTQK